MKVMKRLREDMKAHQTSKNEQNGDDIFNGLPYQIVLDRSKRK